MRKRPLTGDDLLSDIEFELVQGAISRSDLGRGVQALRRHQSQMRTAILQSSQQVESREVVARLLQFNDMMLTLLEETAHAIRSVQLDLRRLARLSTNVSAGGGSASLADPVKGKRGNSVDSPGPMDGLGEACSEQVRNAMRSEAVEIEMNVRLGSIPILGGLAKRARIALHSLVLFYVNRLADKQVVVNQVYGDSILRLIETCQHQREQIRMLNAQVGSLQTRLTEAEEER